MAHLTILGRPKGAERAAAEYLAQRLGPDWSIAANLQAGTFGKGSFQIDCLIVGTPGVVICDFKNVERATCYVNHPWELPGQGGVNFHEKGQAAIYQIFDWVKAREGHDVKGALQINHCVFFSKTGAQIRIEDEAIADHIITRNSDVPKMVQTLLRRRRKSDPDLIRRVWSVVRKDEVLEQILDWPRLQGGGSPQSVHGDTAKSARPQAQEARYLFPIARPYELKNTLPQLQGNVNGAKTHVESARQVGMNERIRQVALLAAETQETFRRAMQECLSELASLAHELQAVRAQTSEANLLAPLEVSTGAELLEWNLSDPHSTDRVWHTVAYMLNQGPPHIKTESGAMITYNPILRSWAYEPLKGSRISVGQSDIIELYSESLANWVVHEYPHMRRELDRRIAAEKAREQAHQEAIAQAETQKHVNILLTAAGTIVLALVILGGISDLFGLRWFD